MSNLEIEMINGIAVDLPPIKFLIISIWFEKARMKTFLIEHQRLSFAISSESGGNS